MGGGDAEVLEALDLVGDETERRPERVPVRGRHDAIVLTEPVDPFLHQVGGLREHEARPAGPTHRFRGRYSIAASGTFRAHRVRAQ